MAERDDIRPERGTGQRWSARHAVWAAGLYVLCYLVVAAAAAWTAQYLASTLVLSLLVTGVGLFTLACSLLLVLSICRVPMGARGEAVWMVGLALLFCLTRPRLLAFLGRWLGQPLLGERIAALIPTVVGQELLGNLALILWAVFLGRLVSRAIREGKLLLPVAVVASVADVFTVFWGFVAEASEEAPEVVAAFSASAALPPPPGVVAPILTAVGLGDFLFFALFLAVALRYSMNAVKATWATFVVMAVAPLAFLVWPEAPGLPGLPFISVAVLATNWKHLSYTRSERFALAAAGLLVAVVAAVALLMLRR